MVETRDNDGRIPTLSLVFSNNAINLKQFIMSKVRRATSRNGRPTISAITLLTEAFRLENATTPNVTITMKTKERLEEMFPEIMNGIHPMILSNGNLGERINPEGSAYVDLNDRARALAFLVYQQTN